jgi:adenine-specific DNA-methyltransferase
MSYSSDSLERKVYVASSPIVPLTPVLGDVSSGAPSSSRKSAGVYYTPPRLARLLARWALARNPERILEPAFGEGVFLRAAHEVLAEADVADPAARLHGVEMDPLGAKRLCDAGLELNASQLRQADLLSLDAEELGGGFDAILGNPPYIRHHLLSDELIARGRVSAARLGIDLNGRSDAWAHLVTFLDAKGRMALVLPGSVLHADYARPLLAAFAADRGEVQLIRIGERLFPGVQERTVLLLIDRAKPGGGQVVYRRIANLAGLSRALLRETPRARPDRKKAAAGSTDLWLPWRLTGAEIDIWDELCASDCVFSLGELAKIRIGVVTGANSFFIRSKSEAAKLGKAVGSVPIVSRGAWLKVARWNPEAQAGVADLPSRLVIFPNSDRRLTEAAQSELRRAERDEIHLRSHCARRDRWQAITDVAVPDLFLPYMGSRPRWLVPNEAGATCSNAIHRVWLQPGTGVSAETLAAASWTTLYRLSAELAGRSYGGGVLKLEPNGAVKLRVAAISAPGLLTEIEEALRVDGCAGATRVADRRILHERLGVSGSELAMMSRAASRLEALRRR